MLAFPLALIGTFALMLSLPSSALHHHDREALMTPVGVWDPVWHTDEWFRQPQGVRPEGSWFTATLGPVINNDMLL